MKRLMMALAGVLLAFACTQGSAQAVTLDLGDVTDSTTNQFSGTGFGGFAYDIKFSLTQQSNVAVLLANFPIAGSFDISGFTATSSDLTLVGGAGGPFSFAGVLVAGNYLVHVIGTAIGASGGLFQTTVAAATVTPIPGALLLFMTAIGGMAGFAGLRRRGSSAA